MTAFQEGDHEATMIADAVGFLARGLARLKRLASLMDTALRIPGTAIRFGGDLALGLIPGAGDVTGLGAIPVTGDIFALLLKSNTRNLKLLPEHFEQERQA
jgi:hypothetical protein